MLYKCIVNLCFYQIPDQVGDDVIARLYVTARLYVIAGLTGNLKPSKFSNFRRNTIIYLSLPMKNGQPEADYKTTKRYDDN